MKNFSNSKDDKPVAEDPDNSVQPTGGIDLNAVRLSQEYGSMAKTAKLLTHISVTRPPKDQFFRVHPDEEYRLEAMVIDRGGDEVYLLHPDVAGLFPDLARPVRLHLYVTRPGAIALWALKLPTDDGTVNSWLQSAAEAAEIAKSRWIRLVANRDMGCYDVFEALDMNVEPKWPDKTMSELVNKAFSQRYVDNEEHPLVKELLGIS
jgi:hypothetical protein